MLCTLSAEQFVLMTRFETVLHVNTMCLETLEKTEEAGGIVNIGNKTQKNIMTPYIVPNSSFDKRYPWRLANIAASSLPCMRDETCSLSMIVVC